MIFERSLFFIFGVVCVTSYEGVSDNDTDEIVQNKLKFNTADSYIQMGNTNQNPISTQQTIESSEGEHPHLGTIQNTNHPKYGRCLKKTYHFADQMMGQQKIRRFNARMKKFGNSDYILNVKAAELIPKQQMCSNNCDVHVYFQKYSQSLRSIMSNRFKQKRVFTQQQIYQFVKEVLEALIFQQDNGFKNCHLDKDSIIICGSKVKLIDMGIATCTPYQTFLDKQMGIEGFYLAPELLKDLKDRNYQPYISPKSDIFCLGMMVLELACMESLDNYYDYEKSTIDYESLIHRVSRIVYSVQLKTLIAGMLEYEPELRLGLISAQQNIKKVLHIDQPETTKRSRSSSTKMLKQLLTNSRRTITASHRGQDNKSLTKKPSNSSLTSMASMNSRYSQNKTTEQKDKTKRQHLRKQSQLYPTKIQTNGLRDLIKNKIESRISGERIMIDSNKQNNNKSVNKDIEQDFKQNMKLMQHTRNSHNYGGSNTTFLASYQYQFNKYSTTPKMNEPLQKLSSNYRKQESIFRLIEEDESSSFNSGKPSHNNCNTTINGPELSPVPPMIPQVQETNSIKRSTPIQHVIQEVTEFDEENIDPPIIICHDNQKKCINIEKYSPEPSVSLRVKKSLDKMYKTTQSISSSEEKQYKKLDNNKKVLLSNGYYYEGEVKDGGIFEGNGILYNPQGKILYSGSWLNGLFDGFGTQYNLQTNTAKIDMKNLNENSKNWLKFEGEFSKGKRQGFGTIYFTDGQRFAGCMRNDQSNGYGCFYNSMNEMTSGIWVNNKMQS